MTFLSFDKVEGFIKATWNNMFISKSFQVIPQKLSTVLVLYSNDSNVPKFEKF